MIDRCSGLRSGAVCQESAAPLLAIVFAFQAQLLYLPNIAGAGLAATPESIGLSFEEARLTASDGVKLHGWLVLAPRSRRVVLHFHGNGGNISHRLELLRLLHGMGLSVFLLDYRGYGMSESRPSETGTYLDAAAAWTYLVDQRGYAPDDIILFGHSLGAAVAAYLGGQVRPGALILESPFISIPDIAAHHYWFLPARALVRFRYATAEYAVCRVRSERGPGLSRIRKLRHVMGDSIVCGVLTRHLATVCPVDVQCQQLRPQQRDPRRRAARSWCPEC
jgi:pimeloyl-ACP methyl ester carboxylesterase